MRARHALLASVALALAVQVSAGAREHFPEFTAPVVDAADVVPDDVEQAVNDRLNRYQQGSGNQVAVAVVKTTGNQSLEDYSIDLARSWGIGDEKEDDGALLLIAYDDRRLRIEVGGGLEDELTDLESGRIIREHITPQLRNGDVGAAVDAGTAMMIQAIGGDLAPPQQQFADEERRGGNPLALALPLLFIFGGLGSFFGRRGRRRRGIGWEMGLLPILLGSGWGGRSGSGGFGGGDGGFGGGFGGGGGGGFSGGGASGDW